MQAPRRWSFVDRGCSLLKLALAGAIVALLVGCGQPSAPDAVDRDTRPKIIDDSGLTPTEVVPAPKPPGR